MSSPCFNVLRVTDFIQLIQGVPSFEGSGELRIDGQALRTVKYTDDFVLLAMEETVGQPQGIIDRIIGRKTLWNGHERGKQPR